MPESFFNIYQTKKNLYFFESSFDFFVMVFLLSKVMPCQVDSITSRWRDVGERKELVS